MQKPLVLCVVTNGRPEVTLSCAISLIKLQNLGLRADMHFVPSLNEALNILWREQQDVAGMLVCGTSIGFDADFVTRALAAGRDIVAGTYPLPLIDWERVKTQPANEPPDHWGIRYNLTPREGAEQVDGYAETAVHELGLAWIARDVVHGIVSAHPEIMASRDHADFATPGVYDGKQLSETERFLALYGKPVYADVNVPASNTGMTEFGGCVGLRSTLR